MNKEKQKLFVPSHGSSCLCDECMALHFEAEPAENRNKKAHGRVWQGFARECGYNVNY